MYTSRSSLYLSGDVAWTRSGEVQMTFKSVRSKCAFHNNYRSYVVNRRHWGTTRESHVRARTTLRLCLHPAIFNLPFRSSGLRRQCSDVESAWGNVQMLSHGQASAFKDRRQFPVPQPPWWSERFPASKFCSKTLAKVLLERLIPGLKILLILFINLHQMSTLFPLEAHTVHS